jgi:sporulation protein YlmC with PRC-barrel domain
VVKSNRPPFHEYLVPVEQVQETTPNLIKLKCTRNDLNQMKPFEYEEYVRTEFPNYPSWAYIGPPEGEYYEEVVEYVPMKRQNIPEGELAVRRGARVEATDGYVGQVDELVVNSNTMQVTHLVLLTGHIFKLREITIPVSQIDYVDEDTIYLKLDRQSVEELPTTPIQR